LEGPEQVKQEISQAVSADIGANELKRMKKKK